MQRQHEHNQRRESQLRTAGIVGIAGNALLAGAKITVGYLTHSLAVIGDGIDSATDIITSVIGLFTASIANKPPDREHPYGHQRAETIATKLLSFTITFAGIQLFISTVKHLIDGETLEIPGNAALYVTLFSIAGKIALALYKGRLGRRINSPMLKADAQNMRNDVLLSTTVLTGVVLSQLLALPILDRILALGISVIIIKSGVGIFMETSEELMDGLDDPDVYRTLFSAVREIPGVHHPHRARIRKINFQLLVDLDIEVKADLTVQEGHSIANKVESRIKERVPEVSDVLVHVEPLGVQHAQESYGLDEDDVC
ncbi:cation diffusion facilitator family transporter [Salinispira pacifica]|uniref:Cobalt-zinc-cadmium resistance protein n=1 Tax=Salinispira pacifica TaxID=1307761 RepID=V5WHC8_9SPIO|nr:cation diffusion facilitator family transporter [Salinispira pacifica]AHC14959.1 Cobalt-zinc-cadmium resistance protein [Salinispira pacifica]